jgi:hypothetical protein
VVKKPSPAVLPDLIEDRHWAWVFWLKKPPGKKLKYLLTGGRAFHSLLTQVEP